MMAYASAEDVATALGRSLTSDESSRASGLLDEATDLVIGYLGVDAAPVPGAVTRVVARMVARVFERDADPSAAATGAVQYGRTGGPFSEQVTYEAGVNSSSPWLDARDRLKLKPYRIGMTSAPMGGEHTGRYRRFV